MPTEITILVSFINMKLRDEYDSLEELCAAYDTAPCDILTKLKAAGYKYDSENRSVR